jgi:hypothetical protein
MGRDDCGRRAEVLLALSRVPGLGRRGHVTPVAVEAGNYERSSGLSRDGSSEGLGCSSVHLCPHAWHIRMTSTTPGRSFTVATERGSPSPFLQDGQGCGVSDIAAKPISSGLQIVNSPRKAEGGEECERSRIPGVARLAFHRGRGSRCWLPDAVNQMMRLLNQTVDLHSSEFRYSGTR